MGSAFRNFALLLIVVALGAGAAGGTSSGLDRVVGLPADLSGLLETVAAADSEPLPHPRACVVLPLPPVGVACAGADWTDEGEPCRGLGAPRPASHTGYADVAYTGIPGTYRYGAFIHCNDQPGIDGPGTDYYARWVLLVHAAGAETPGPAVLWWEVGYVPGPDAEAVIRCGIDVYVHPLGIAASEPCHAGSPPHPPALPS